MRYHPKTRGARRRTGILTLVRLAVMVVVLFVATSASALSAREVDELLASWQMAEANTAIETLEARHPEAPETLYLRARYDFFEGRYAEAVDRLDQAISLSPRAEWQQLRDVVAATRDVTKGYVKHSSPKGYFDVYVEPGKDQVLLPYAFEALDSAYEAFKAEIGYAPPTPIRVEVYPQTKTLAAVSILTEDEIKTSGTIALCKYNRLMITSPKALMRGYGWVDTLVHEYVHFVINKRTSNRVPIWMHEGLAKFLERRWRGAEAHRLSPSSEHLLHKRVKADDLITFEEMHPSMAKLPSQEDASVAFAEVYVAMEFLRERAGTKAFKMLLDNIAEGQDARVAIANVIGANFSTFQREWRAYLKTRPGVPNFPDESGFEERLVFKDDAKKPTNLSQIPQPKARDHMHLGEMLQARERYAAAVVEYQKAERIAGKTNPILQTRLAQSLIALGRFEDAREALAEVKDVFPGFVVTWVQLGKASIGVGDYEAAVRYLREAARINPFDPEVHRELGRAYAKLGRVAEAERARNDESLVN